MKFLLTFFCVVLGCSFVEASPIVGTVEDVFCGEIDPHSVGRACLVFTTDERSQKKYGLVYQNYDWSARFSPQDGTENDVVGDRFQAEYCSQIKDGEAIRDLKTYDPGYFYLLCKVDGFKFFYGNQLY